MRTEDFRDTVDNDENGLVLVLSSCSSVLLMSISTRLLTILYISVNLVISRRSISTRLLTNLYISVNHVVNVDIDQVVGYFVHQGQSCC